MKIDYLRGIVLAVCATLSLVRADARDASSVTVTHVEQTPPSLKRLPVKTFGRVAAGVTPNRYLRQWPGTAFQTSLQGSKVIFRLGDGSVKLHVLVDGKLARTLVKPSPGFYRIGGLSAGPHVVRLEVASESQATPTGFDGFFGEGATRALPSKRAQRQIEFIGDSHTVGYANTKIASECTEEEVWAATDSSQGVGPTLARSYGADYRINAISGRGVVRNYNGFSAATLPIAYKDTLFGQSAAALPDRWDPQVIVISLGTNDFTTPLNESEKWKTRAALHADFESGYLTFIHTLLQQHPDALFVLWATDMANGEIKSEVAKVAESLKAEGKTRSIFVPIDGLMLNACHGHPSVADDRIMALRLKAAIDQQLGSWHD